MIKTEHLFCPHATTLRHQINTKRSVVKTITECLVHRLN